MNVVVVLTIVPVFYSPLHVHCIKVNEAAIIQFGYNTGIPEGLPTNIDETTFGKYNAEVYRSDVPANPAAATKIFSDLKSQDGYLSKDRFLNSLQPIGHFLKNEYFTPLNWKLKPEVADLIRPYGAEICKEHFKDFVGVAYNGVDKNSDMVHTWYTVMKAEGAVTPKKVLTLCRNTVDLLLPNLVDNSKSR